MQDSPFDLDQAIRRCLGKLEVVTIVLREFEKQAAADLRRIGECVSAGEFDEIGRIAHALKGAAGMISANHLTDLAIAIESAATSQNLMSLEALLLPLKIEVARCLDYLPKARSEMNLKS
jgi:two-component system, sensor histidine kinase and response regulator